MNYHGCAPATRKLSFFMQNSNFFKRNWMQSAISKLQKFKDLNLHELLKNSDGNISEIS